MNSDNDTFMDTLGSYFGVCGLERDGSNIAKWADDLQAWARENDSLELLLGKETCPKKINAKPLSFPEPPLRPSEFGPAASHGKYINDLKIYTSQCEAAFQKVKEAEKYDEWMARDKELYDFIVDTTHSFIHGLWKDEGTAADIYASITKIYGTKGSMGKHTAMAAFNGIQMTPNDSADDFNMRFAEGLATLKDAGFRFPNDCAIHQYLVTISDEHPE